MNEATASESASLAWRHVLWLSRRSPGVCGGKLPRTHTYTQQGAQGSSKNCTSRESVCPLSSRLIRGFRNKYH